MFIGRLRRKIGGIFGVICVVDGHDWTPARKGVVKCRCCGMMKTEKEASEEERGWL